MRSGVVCCTKPMLSICLRIAAHLVGLTYLKKVDLSDTQVTDAGLVHLAGLTILERLWLPRQVTDAGLRWGDWGAESEPGEMQ